MPVLGRTVDIASESRAHALDAGDVPTAFRDRFYVQPDTIYLDGTSLILWGAWG